MASPIVEDPVELDLRSWEGLLGWQECSETGKVLWFSLTMFYMRDVDSRWREWLTCFWRRLSDRSTEALKLLYLWDMKVSPLTALNYVFVRDVLIQSQRWSRHFLTDQYWLYWAIEPFCFTSAVTQVFLLVKLSCTATQRAQPTSPVRLCWATKHSMRERLCWSCLVGQASAACNK